MWMVVILCNMIQDKVNFIFNLFITNHVKLILNIYQTLHLLCLFIADIMTDEEATSSIPVYHMYTAWDSTFNFVYFNAFPENLTLWLKVNFKVMLEIFHAWHELWWWQSVVSCNNPFDSTCGSFCIHDES